jgi:hypothetical protein
MEVVWRGIKEIIGLAKEVMAYRNQCQCSIGL